MDNTSTPEINHAAAELDEIEQKLSEIWQDVLKTSIFDHSKSFVQLGGHSLKAAILSSRIYKEFKIGIDLPTILNGLSIQGLAALIIDSNKIESVEISETIYQDHYDLSHAQKGIFINSQSAAGNRHYSISKAFIADGFDSEILNTAFFILLNRHESLRTVFKTIDGTPKQKIIDPEDINFTIDHEHFPDQGEHSEIIRKRVLSESDLPFNLEDGPLLRVKVLVLKEQSIIVFTIHHIICDAFSLLVLMEEIKYLYQSLLKNNFPNLPPLRIQYKDFSDWQNRHLSLHGDALKAFWVKELSGNLKELRLHSLMKTPDLKGAEEAGIEGELCRVSISKELSNKIDLICSEFGITPYMYYVAVFSVLFYYYSAEEDLIIGTVLAGRDHADLHRQIGMFAHALPIRSRIDSALPFADLLSEAKEKLLNIFKNQNYPFDKIVKDLNLKRKYSRNPLFNIVVQMLGREQLYHSKIEDDPGFSLKEYDSGNVTCLFDLVFIIIDGVDNLVIEAVYNKNLFESESMKLVLNKLKAIIVSTTDDPYKTICSTCAVKSPNATWQNSFPGYNPSSPVV